MSTRSIPAALAALGLAAALPAAACSSCGCSLNSDWSSQGYAAGKGLRFDLRFDEFDQSELHSGVDRVARNELELPNEREVQRYTLNHNTQAALDWAPSRRWGVNVALPWFDRDHATYVEDTDALSYSHSSGVGDLRVVGRFQGFDDDASVGVTFGLKLPTGRTDVEFAAGPAAGERLDRGLQPGTGTVDALIGAYRFGNFAQDWSWFAQGQLQLPLDSHDGFKPGSGLNVNAGVRYLALGGFTPQLQLNLRAERRESGAAADVDNSGATLLHVAPGASYRFDRHVEAYGFVQLPVYQHVDGLQLEPRVLYSIGLRIAR